MDRIYMLTTNIYRPQHGPHLRKALLHSSYPTPCVHAAVQNILFAWLKPQCDYTRTYRGMPLECWMLNASISPFGKPSVSRGGHGEGC